MKKILLISVITFLWSCKTETKKEATEQMPMLRVSENGRFFTGQKEEPFFWLGDTGWLLFTKLSREEAVQYLDNRAEKGFNVIQVMVLHEVGAKKPVRRLGIGQSGCLQSPDHRRE